MLLQCDKVTVAILPLKAPVFLHNQDVNNSLICKHKATVKCLIRLNRNTLWICRRDLATGHIRGTTGQSVNSARLTGSKQIVITVSYELPPRHCMREPHIPDYPLEASPHMWQAQETSL